jgi:hypothetical protein
MAMVERRRRSCVPDTEALLAQLRSPDEEARVKALHRVCPCASGFLVYERFRSEVRRLQKDPSPRVRAAALHVEADACVIEEIDANFDRAGEQGWRYSDADWVRSHRRRQARRTARSADESVCSSAARCSTSRADPTVELLVRPHHAVGCEVRLDVRPAAARVEPGCSARSDTCGLRSRSYRWRDRFGGPGDQSPRWHCPQGCEDHTYWAAARLPFAPTAAHPGGRLRSSVRPVRIGLPSQWQGGRHCTWTISTSSSPRSATRKPVS